MTRLVQLKWWIVTLLFIPALVLGACSDDSTATDKDSSVDTTGFQKDGLGNPDNRPSGDVFVWPDSTNSGDTWQWPDLYSGTPFGCQTDADCFGRQCCATPWGVKVCADSCNP